jgi:hypothetical protein
LEGQDLKREPLKHVVVIKTPSKIYAGSVPKVARFDKIDTVRKAVRELSIST